MRTSTTLSGSILTLSSILYKSRDASAERSQNGRERQATPVVPVQFGYLIGATTEWATKRTTSRRQRPAVRLP
jgi:hypothetical protein